MQWGTTLRNAWLDLIETTVGTSMKIRFLTGAMPANCAAAETGTLICEMTCPSNYFNAASGGAMEKTGTWSGTSVATGLIGYARFLNNAGSVVHGQATTSQALSLTTSASSAANSNVLTFTSTTGVYVGYGVYGVGIETGSTVLAVTSTTVTMSMASTAGVGSAARITFGDITGDTFINVVDITSVGQAIVFDEFSIVAPGA